ncbi:hypothetical protein [Proteus cibi]|uniref:hypothetical protein n=1 Tax=Proteus cibi TaxID=2050966 RepID=UPI0035A73FB1
MSIDEITQRREAFRKDLYSSKYNMEWIFHKHLINKATYAFLDNPDEEHELAVIVKEYFNVDYKDFIIVGSAKLGYSLNPKKNYRNFTAKSDIDVAIIDQGLFIDLKQELYDFTDGLCYDWNETVFHRNPTEYIHSADLEKKEGQRKIYENQFNYYKYLSKGWFRADFKPDEFEICRNGKRFIDFQSEIYSRFSKKIGLAIYENWFFFIKYHVKNLENLKLRTGVDTDVAK